LNDEPSAFIYRYPVVYQCEVVFYGFHGLLFLLFDPPARFGLINTFAGGDDFTPELF
jgi:hypothetical protein